MKRFWKWSPAAVVVASLLPAVAWAGRPMNTEDAGVLGDEECELEITAAHDSVDGDSESTTALAAQWACGIGYRTHLAMAVQNERAAGERAESITLNGKTAWVEMTDERGWGLAWVYGAEASRPAQGSFEHVESHLTLAGSWVLTDRTTAHASVGLSHDVVSKLNNTAWSAGLEWKATDTVDATLEAYGDNSQRDDWTAMGLRWSPAESWSLNASFGLLSSDPKQRLFIVGLTASF